MTNCYLLQQPDAALADRHRLRRRRAGAARADRVADRRATLPLSLLPLRLNEFMSIQNIDPFTLYFNVKECFTGNPDAAFWFDFGAGSDSGQNTLDRLNITTIGREETIPIGTLGPPGRRLPGADPPDRHALDLRRGDQDAVHLRHVHPHLARPPDGPWIIQDGDDDPTDFDHVRSFLLNTRYWWLEGVDTDEAAQGHRQDPRQARHRDHRARLRLHPARQEDGREAHPAASTTCLKSLDKSVAMSRYVGRDEER